jgi:Fe-S-cluster containining protein
MKESNIQEIVQELVSGNINNMVDCSINGKCSKCGECCSNFLPVSQSEVDKIQKYVIEHKIRPQTQLLIMQNTLTCPYYNGKKCLIYEVRPLICKEFYCYKKPTAEMGKKFQEEEHFPVDMWAIAKEIDKYFRR